MANRRIGILTGGGDVPGLNSVIKTVVYRGSRTRMRSRRHSPRLGRFDPRQPRRSGQQGAVHPAAQPRQHPHHRSHWRNLPAQLANQPCEDEEATSGHWRVRSSEPKESTKKGVTSTVFDVTPAVLKNLEALGLDYLIAIGGDDTLSYAAALDRKGMKVIAVPKTMDNDVRNTEYCIGFSTAITRAMDAIDRQRTTVGSHERIGIFRVFGRDAGYTALYTAYVTSIRCCIPEYKVDLEQADRSAAHRTSAAIPATTRSSFSPRARSGRATK